MATVTSPWRGHSDALGDHLANLLALNVTTDPADLDTALHARTAVLDLATTVHFDLTGLRRHRRASPGDGELYVHPVAHLARLLHERDRPHPQRSLTEVLGEPASSRVGQLWQQVARDGVLAHHEWTRIDTADRQIGSAAWTAMHELAQFTHAITWLDDDLTTTCRQAGRTAEAALLSERSSRLRPVAAAVATLAASGPLPPIRDLHPPPGRRPFAIRHEEQVPTVLDRLAFLVGTAEHISPLHIQATYRVLARVVAQTAEMLASTAPLRLVQSTPVGGASSSTLDLAAGMREHSRLLHLAGRTPGRVQTLLPSNDAAVAQAQLLATFTTQRGSGLPKGWETSPGRVPAFAAAAAGASARATFALQDTVIRHLQDGRWLVPPGDRRPSRLIWVPSDPRHTVTDNQDAPTLLTTATRAARHAAHLADHASKAAPSRAAPVTAALPPGGRSAVGDLLADALLNAERRAAPLTIRPTTVNKPLTR